MGAGWWAVRVIAVMQGREAGGVGQSGYSGQGEKGTSPVSISELDLAGLCPGLDGGKEERNNG